MNHIGIKWGFLSPHHEIKKPSMPYLRSSFNTFQPLEMLHLPSWRLMKGLWNEWNEIDSYQVNPELLVCMFIIHSFSSITLHHRWLQDLLRKSQRPFVNNGCSIKTCCFSRELQSNNPGDYSFNGLCCHKSVSPGLSEGCTPSTLRGHSGTKTHLELDLLPLAW